MFFTLHPYHTGSCLITCKFESNLDCSKHQVNPRVLGRPLFAQAEPKLYTVNAGDTLYIPAFHWHWVHSEGTPDAPQSVAVNLWTKHPHRAAVRPGCDLNNPTKKCGHDPFVIRNDAKGWGALKWSLDEIQHAVEANTDATNNGKDQAFAERLGSCASADHVYPEMYSLGIMRQSRFHAERSPPKPETLGDIMTAIKHIQEGQTCHCVIPFKLFTPGMAERGGIVAPSGARPPAAYATKQERFLWVTGGNVTSGLHFDQVLCAIQSV